MIMTGGPSDPGRGPRTYMSTGIGRVRGLRQGGRSMYGAKKSAAGSKKGGGGAKPPMGSGARFKNLVGQLSKKPGSTDPKALSAMMSGRGPRSRRTKGRA